MNRSPRPNDVVTKSSNNGAGRMERQTNFKVVIRVRPPLPRELNGEVAFQNIVAVDEREQQITVSENLHAVLDQNGNVLANTGPYSTHSFVFDHVYDENSSQEKVYETTARTVVDSALQGYNATIFAYGQTGTGKTYTMEGFNQEGSVEARGIIPRAIEQIFGHIQRNASARMRFLVRASYLQIYNEQISDLLKPDRNNLTIREDKRRGVFVDGLSEWVVRSPAEIYGLMERGGNVRATGETKMNEVSSRSHAVFIVIAEQSMTVYVDEKGREMSPEDFQKFMHTRGVRRENDMSRLEEFVRQSFKVGKLNLVDLAGSERVRLSGATGQRLEESKQINRSLASLGNVISALTDTKNRQHIPYRDSKLTRMLEDSLGGNCKTTMMAMISPALESMTESLSTLKFANRAKNIKNEARVNEDLDQKSLLRKYERELRRLRAELEAKSKNVVDKRRLLELDEQRKQAEADKLDAYRRLEARTEEFKKEKEEKSKLEQRIARLVGQMIGNKGEAAEANLGELGMKDFSGILGGSLTDGAVKEQQEILRQEYQDKLANLEKEREIIEEDKAQVDRYKQLLLKQRDIMIALTHRLVERDEQIMALQDELDAYDQHHKELEDKLDKKTEQYIRLQRITKEMEVNGSSPSKMGEELSKLQLENTKVDMNDNSSSSSNHKRMTNRINELEMIVSNQRKEMESSKEQMASALHRSNTDRLQLDNRVKELTVELAKAKAKSNSSSQDSSELRSMKERNEILVKEREAVHTIMEQKIRILVQSVSQAMTVVLRSSPQTPGSAALALSKDVASLERLVNASISALRHAANSNEGRD